MDPLDQVVHKVTSFHSAEPTLFKQAAQITDSMRVLARIYTNLPLFKSILTEQLYVELPTDCFLGVTYFAEFDLFIAGEVDSPKFLLIKYGKYSIVSTRQEDAQLFSQCISADTRVSDLTSFRLAISFIRKQRS